MDLSPFYPARRADARKGDYGRVLVVGGSDRYAGAIAFNALAAMRAGADLAYVVAPRRSADIVASYSPDLITVPCNTPYPDPKTVLEFADTADAVVIGGGVERTPQAHEAILQILRGLRGKRVVADAEALHALAKDMSALDGITALLTPHGGEFRAIAEEDWPLDEDARKKAASEFSKRIHQVIIVKGHRDIIADGDRVVIDKAGSPYLTKGGYGDMLAGVAGALMSRAVKPYDAARAAAYIVGTAGSRSAAELGEGTLASDSLARIAKVVRETA